MNKLTAPRPLLVDSPSDSGFATTSWGEQARLRLRAAETEGRLAVLFYRAPAGFGPPRHLHRRDDEIFLIEQGAIALWTPHECRTAGPGDVVMLPKVMPHTWRAYGDDPIRFQVTVIPGEFETFFERIAERNLTLADIRQPSNDSLILASARSERATTRHRGGADAVAALCGVHQLPPRRP